mmetsp:Transcript_125718/g.367337  ORF Transcript_125718/g.367337 Transcript_125718/m.367337 type:complete len:792 (-) Transcript_125718:286-2661(-)
MSASSAVDLDKAKFSACLYSHLDASAGQAGQRAAKEPCTSKAAAFKRLTCISLFAVVACLVLTWFHSRSPAHASDGRPAGPLLPNAIQGKYLGHPSARLHFLFLAMTDVMHSDEWSSFLAGAPAGSWTVWLHCKNSSACLSGDFMRRVPQARLVPSVPTAYCVDLVSAEVQLLRYALQEDATSPNSEADKFVLLSDSTLPVKSFAEVFAVLTGHRESDFCIYPTDQWDLNKSLSGSTKARVPAHSQFVQLSRQDASTFVTRWDADKKGHTQKNLSFTDGYQEIVTWTVPVLDGKSKDDVLSIEDFGGWSFCADELAAFSVIFGSVVFDSENRRVIDGFGTLWYDDKHASLTQGRCYTYFSFYYWSLDDWTLESRLAKVRNSTLHQTSEDAPTHPLEFGDLSAGGLQLLRDSPYLFARKFQADAQLPDYGDVVLKPRRETEVPGPVLHFMFLAIDAVAHASIWREFFARAPHGAWRAWLHCKEPAACRESDIFRLIPGIRLVKTLPTSYCNDLLSASVQLMDEALRSTAAPPGTMEKFILVSDTTLPVKPFSEIYQALTAHDTSDFCLYPSSEWLQAEVDDRVLYAIQHHEWVVLNRPDAYTLWTKWAPTWDEDMWPDWNVSLRAESRAVAGRRHMLASEFSDGHPSWACTDELAPFNILYGAFVPGVDGTQNYTGIGTVSLREKLVNQGRCRTFVMWNVTSTQEEVKQAIVGDPCTDLILPTWGKGGGDPAAFGGFSDEALRQLRASDYLFVRKVLPNATLSNYVEVAFADSPKLPLGLVKPRALRARCGS